MRWRFVFSEMAIGLRRNLSMTIATILTIAIALSGMGAAWLMKEQTGKTRDYWFGKIQISVFMTKDVTEQERDAIRQQLQALPQVAQIFYESKAEAYARFKEQFKSVPALVKNTEPGALPESYRVKLKDPKKFPIVKSAVQNMPGVDSVGAESEELKKLFRLLDRLQTTMFLVAISVLIASVLLIFNNVRVAAFSRRRETGIMRLVGASDLYIQAPFILEIAVSAAIGGAMAVSAMFGMKWLVIDHGFQPAFGRILEYVGWGTVAGMAPFIFGGGILIGAVTAFGTLQRYLRV